MAKVPSTRRGYAALVAVVLVLAIAPGAPLATGGTSERELTADEATRRDPLPVLIDFADKVLTGVFGLEKREWAIVDLYDQNRRRRQRFVLPLDGRVTGEVADRLAVFFACPHTRRKRRLHRGVLAMLADVARTYPGHTIEITSAYRARRSESRTSPHRGARAIDFRVHGVNIRKVRDYLWVKYDRVGIGFYPHQGFLHMDVRPEQKGIAWTQVRYNGHYVYHPYWAARARARARDHARALDRASAPAPRAEAAGHVAGDGHVSHH